MKKIKSILATVYKFWLFIGITLVWCARHFLHCSPWWWAAFVGYLIALEVINRVKCLGFLRFITWPTISEPIRNTFAGKHVIPLTAYPFVIWLELTGKSLYKKEGYKAFLQGVRDHCDGQLIRLQQLHDELDTPDT